MAELDRSLGKKPARRRLVSADLGCAQCNRARVTVASYGVRSCNTSSPLPRQRSVCRLSEQYHDASLAQWKPPGLVQPFGRVSSWPVTARHRHGLDLGDDTARPRHYYDMATATSPCQPSRGRCLNDDQRQLDNGRYRSGSHRARSGLGIFFIFEN
jgi:hypothetical protein